MLVLDFGNTKFGSNGGDIPVFLSKNLIIYKNVIQVSWLSHGMPGRIF